MRIATTAGSFLGDPRNEATGLFGMALCAGAYAFASRARRSACLNSSLRVDLLAGSLIIVPFDRWSSVTKKGISLALQLAGQTRVLHVGSNEKQAELESLWERNVVSPLKVAGKKIPELVILKDTKGHSLRPMVDYILAVEREDADRQIIVVMPHLEVRHWWQRPLHNYRNRMLKWMLAARASQRLMIIDVPWYL